MKISRRLVLACSAFFLYAAPAPIATDGSGAREPRRAVAPANFKDGLSPAEAQSDFKIMHAIFTRAHATAFLQIPKGETPDLFKDAKQVSIRDFITRILGYYRGLHVDHTGLGFSPKLVEDLGLKTAIFPFPLKFLGGKAYLDCALADIPFGSELLSMNGQSLAQILQELEFYSGIRNAGGAWDDYRLTENFSFLYYLRHGRPKDWEVEIKGPRETKSRKLVWKIAELEHLPPVPRRSGTSLQYAQPLYSMFNPSLKAAYLAINSFMPAAGGLDTIDSWNNHLNLFHQEARAKKSENLVIDLRQNRGGVMLFSAAAATWFIESPLEDKSRSRTRTRILPHREYAQSLNGLAATDTMIGDVEKHLQTGFVDKLVDGYFNTRQTDARFLQLTPINIAHRFKKIYILIGPATYSAAVNFARLVKLGNPNVVFVGEETGSPGDGHSAEILVSYQLPASRLLFEIPLMRVEFAPLVQGQLPARGIFPDVVVKESAADFIAGHDAVLEAASRAMGAP